MQTLLENFKHLPAALQVLIVLSGAIASTCTTVAVALQALPKTTGAVKWLYRAGHDLSFVTNWLMNLKQRVIAALTIGVVLVLCSCAPKYAFVAATDSDGDKYEFCFKVSGSAFAFSGKAMGCADVESQVIAQEQAFMRANPGVRTMRVRQLKVAQQ